jgi:hypothetical protein
MELLAGVVTAIAVDGLTYQASVLLLSQVLSAVLLRH